jgi:hypothetical protein
LSKLVEKVVAFLDHEGVLQSDGSPWPAVNPKEQALAVDWDRLFPPVRRGQEGDALAEAIVGSAVLPAKTCSTREMIGLLVRARLASGARRQRLACKIEKARRADDNTAGRPARIVARRHPSGLANFGQLLIPRPARTVARMNLN